jgi:hypothetical protein
VGPSAVLIAGGALLSRVALASRLRAWVYTELNSSISEGGMANYALEALAVEAGDRSEFFLLATQNPIEMEDTYPAAGSTARPLLFKLRVRYPAIEEHTGSTSSAGAGSIFSRIH